MVGKKKVELTDASSHIATAKGYAAGMLIEEGQRVPPGVPVGSWMAEAPKAEPEVQAD